MPERMPLPSHLEISLRDKSPESNLMANTLKAFLVHYLFKFSRHASWYIQPHEYLRYIPRVPNPFLIFL